MKPQEQQINWQAIHKAYNDHVGMKGAQHPTPQPQGNPPAHAMMIHAMSLANQQPGEDHGSMIIRGILEHLKRTSPDISSIHKQPSPQTGGK